MNLVLNAIHASRSGHQNVIRIAGRVDGDRVHLTVSDRGQGIPPEVAERIFDPFFTTRADRGGTGLGLAIVRSFVEDAGGGVEVHSVVGEGSRFELTVPVAHGQGPPR